MSFFEFITVEQFRYFLSVLNHVYMNWCMLYYCVCLYSSLPSVTAYMRYAELEAAATRLQLGSRTSQLNAHFLFADPCILHPLAAHGARSKSQALPRIKNSSLRAEFPLLPHKGQNKCKVTQRM